MIAPLNGPLAKYLIQVWAADQLRYQSQGAGSMRSSKLRALLVKEPLNRK